MLVDQFVGAVGYLLIALILGFARRKRKAFDMATVLRAMIAGASLPPALMLAIVPLFPDELKLFGETTIQAYIMIAGLVLAVLSIYGLVK